MITIFFERLKKLCLDRNTTPTSLCKALGLSTSMPTNWKSGRIPSGTTLLKIANYFGVTTNYLLGQEEPVLDSNMFWQRFYVLCRQSNSSPEAIAKELSIASSYVASWQFGSLPAEPMLKAIAERFSVTVDYLLGKENPPQPFLSQKEAELVRRMQELDDAQAQQLLEYMEFLIQQRKKKDGE